MKTETLITDSLSKKINLIISLCITTLFSCLSLVLMPIFLGNIVSSVINDGRNLTLWCLLTSSCVILRILFQYIKSNQTFTLGNFITTTLQKEAYGCAIKAETEEITVQDPEYLTKTICNDSKKIGYEYIATNIVNFISSSVYLIMIFISMMCIAPILGIISLIGIPLYYFGIKWVTKLYVRSSKELQRIEDDGNKVVEENFKKINDIKVKNGIKKEIDDYCAWYDNTSKKHGARWKLDNLSNGFIGEAIVSVIFIVVMLVGFNFAYHGEGLGVSLGNVISFIIYIPTIYITVLKIMGTRISPSTIKGEMTRLNQIFAFRSEVRSEPITSIDELLTVKFSDVSFGEQGKVVNNVSFEMKNNEKIGILCLDDYSSDIIFDLFIKVKRPRSGVITFNNCDTGKISTSCIRDLIAGVSKTSDLFDDTIMSNVTYPSTFDEYKYNDSLYKAQLKDIIFELEEKDNTLVSDIKDSVKKQVILANAFYKDSKIFIFNNCLQNLESNIEEEVLKEISKLRNKFVVIMSDRAYELVNCDKILIIENGKVVEYGLTSELEKNKDSLFFKSIRKIKLSKAKAS